MKEFENSLIRGIHKSRYMASWIKSVLKSKNIKSVSIYDFRNWLKSLEFDDEEKYLTEDEITDIFYYATNGKLELELNADEFIKNI